MRGFAALALVAGFSSCVKDVDGTSQKEIDDRSKENAEMQLGISIPDGQTWDMASQVEANVTVNGDYGVKYTVSIYENNPFINNTAVVLGKAETVSGGTASTSFTCPDATKSVFVAIKDEKGYSYVKPAAVVDGKIETTFGGEAAAGARSMRAANRSAADDFVIPTYTQPDVTGYKNGAYELDEKNCEGDYYIGSECISQKKLIMSSDWSAKIAALGLTDSQYQGNYARTLYIDKDATWTVSSDQPTLGQGTVVVVAGEIVIPTGVTLNTSGDPTYNCQIIVLPNGKITGGGKLSFNNGSLTGKYDYIGGTVDVGTINNNGGEVYIAGEMKANNLEGGAGYSTYINAGKVVVNGSVYGSSSANMRVLNNCWWECKGDISCRNIVQGTSAYFHAASLAMSCGNDSSSDHAYIYAKANSLLDITGAVSLNNVDIVGPTENYAYLQFGSVGMTENATNWTESYDGGRHMSVGAIQNNVRISVDNPDVNVNMYDSTPYEKVLDMLNGTRSYTAGQADPSWSEWQAFPQQGNGNAILAKKLVIDTTVEPAEGDCAPTFKEEPPTPIDEKAKVYTYAFEDQTVGTDYDMNDVVLKVSYKKSTNAETDEVEYDKTKLVATLVAAGATYNIKVKIGNTELFEGKEIHKALGVNAGVMVNTGNGQTATPVSDEIATKGLADENGNIDFTQLPVSIEVLSTDKTYSYPNTDAYPHAIMVPTDWAWPTERTIITEAYPGTSDANKVDIGGNEEKNIKGAKYPENSFAAWAGTLADKRNATMNGWYNHPNGKTMTND